MLVAMVVFATLVLLGSTAAAAEFPEVSRLPSHPEFPDPLVMLNGERVTTKDQWLNQRRPELKALFQHYMYGYLPAPPERVTFTVEREDRQFFNGKATEKEVTIAFGPPNVPTIHLLLVVPNKRSGPAPAFVGMNFCGNHALVNDPKVRVPTVWMYPNRGGVKDNHATEEGRGTEIDAWALEQSIDRGYAVATFYNGDIDPDQNARREGIRPWLAGRKVDAGRETATIMAWAWGISRAVDYLVSDKDIDAKRIAVVGHSRLGKTAIVAAAFDERIALAIPLQAGCGGTAPNRQHNPKVESVKRINTGFPHWFNAQFKEFNDHTDKLPFDQHCLVALVAPRPVLFSNAVEDVWANPDGQFHILQAADPVYRLLNAGGLDAKQVPAVGKLLDSPLGYYIRPGKHAMTREDWKVFLDFADKHLGKPEATK